MDFADPKKKDCPEYRSNRYLNEEFSLHALTGGTADPKKNEISAQQQQRYKGVHRPDGHGAVEGENSQKLDQGHERTQCHGTAAKDIEPAPFYIPQQGNQGGENNAQTPYQRKRKAEESAPAGVQINI